MVESSFPDRAKVSRTSRKPSMSYTPASAIPSFTRAEPSGLLRNCWIISQTWPALPERAYFVGASIGSAA